MKETEWICPESNETCRPVSRHEMTVFCFVMVAALLGWFFLAGLVLDYIWPNSAGVQETATDLAHRQVRSEHAVEAEATLLVAPFDKNRLI